MLLVLGIGDGVEEQLEAGDAADILGWGAAGAVDVAGILGSGIGVGDCLDRDCVSPVVTEVVGVSEAFVKTLKRDYVHVTPLPDATTVLGLIAG